MSVTRALVEIGSTISCPSSDVFKCVKLCCVLQGFVFLFSVDELKHRAVYLCLGSLGSIRIVFKVAYGVRGLLSIFHLDVKSCVLLMRAALRLMVQSLHQLEGI